MIGDVARAATTRRNSLTGLIVAGTVMLLSTSIAAQQLTATEAAAIDRGVLAVLAETDAPSASIAIVRDGAIVYEKAYGKGRITPDTAAAASMRYAIGSISKQFTATAILLLGEEGKLLLDDRVAKWFPDLTRASEVSVRQLLSMTSGYQDYWPLDYVSPDMQRAVAVQAIMQRWAGRALDFDPGTKWQYSNTNYVIAAAIVERVAGMGFMDFLRKRIFTPLRMSSVTDVDTSPLGPGDAQALLRNALGPLRAAPKEGAGWSFGTGQLAMTAHDLALWDIAVIERTVLRPDSYRTQQTTALLTAGTATGYGLGISVGTPGGRRTLSHGGVMSGYATNNLIYPDDRAAIVVFTNVYPGAADAPRKIGERIASIIFSQADATADEARELSRKIYDGLMKGTIDRGLLTQSANAYFTPETLADYAASLEPLGAPSEFASGGQSLRGGMTIRTYRIRAGTVVLSLTTMTLPDGRLDQYILERAG
jgi:D-alanyl-D-alanine carboxypeptidase